VSLCQSVICGILSLYHHFLYNNPMIKTDAYLKTALVAAAEGGKLFEKYFGNPGKVEMKFHDPRNLVTEIDRKIERLIRQRIIKKFPDHRIVGEELESSKPSKQVLVWYIDPIDGTANFIRGFPFCCVSLALWDKNGPLVGVVHNPALKQTFWAARKLGAFCNGKRMKVSKENRLAKAFGGYGWGRNIQNAGKHFPELVKDLNKIRTLGTTALEVVMVAKGVYDFHLQAEVNIWDFAAAALILEEAGGKITDWHGKNITPQTKKLIASNGKTHKQLVNIVNKLA